jgi:hypothetical protein
MPSQYARTYNSFSGIDITPVFNGKSIGECQGISYSVSREKAPLYTLGSPNPRSFSRGKRGIAGAVVFLVFDRSALFESLRENSVFWGNTFEQPTSAQKYDDPNTKPTAIVNGTNDAGQGLEAGEVDDTGMTRTILLENKEAMEAYYHDQVPPFDVKLIAATERGHGAVMEILGMEILNCGSGVSVDDITTDESCTWIGVNVIPWHSQTYKNPRSATVGDTYQIDGTDSDAS